MALHNVTVRGKSVLLPAQAAAIINTAITAMHYVVAVIVSIVRRRLSSDRSTSVAADAWLHLGYHIDSVAASTFTEIMITSMHVAVFS